MMEIMSRISRQSSSMRTIVTIALVVLLLGCKQNFQKAEVCWNNTKLRVEIGSQIYEFPANESPLPSDLRAEGIVNRSSENMPSGELTYCQDKQHVPLKVNKIYLSSPAVPLDNALKSKILDLRVITKQQSYLIDREFKSFDATTVNIIDVPRQPLYLKYTTGTIECPNIKMNKSASEMIYCSGFGHLETGASVRVSFAAPADQASTFPALIGAGVAHVRSFETSEPNFGGDR